MLPLLLESLSQSSSVLLETTLDTLLGILKQPVFSDKLMEHIQSMIPRLLPLTTYQHYMKIRMSALHCMHELCSLPTELLLPFKDEVWLNSFTWCIEIKIIFMHLLRLGCSKSDGPEIT